MHVDLKGNTMGKLMDRLTALVRGRKRDASDPVTRHREDPRERTDQQTTSAYYDIMKRVGKG